MRPHPFRNRAALTFFTSSKCEMAVPVDDPLLLHALRQAALDPKVRKIYHWAGPEIECPRVSLEGVVLDRVDGSFLLRVHETRPERTTGEAASLAYALKRHGLRLLERDASDIRREPLFSNSDLVWSYARYHVSITDRLRIALALEDGGPQSVMELEERARPTCDILAAICALACDDLLCIDTHREPLGLRTVVSSR
ncbi:hypothetical protein [Bradyrhizobium sp. McL0615]|uniref:hypothetical protein n=1 Tax=Bradyrhizobium sp. McL0615 TaxID=3415673 RepID=UPI003CFB2CB9